MRNHSQWCEYTCKAISSGAYRHGEHMHGDLTCWEQLGTTNNEKTGLHSIDISVIYRVLTKNWVLKVNGVLTSYFDDSYCLHPKLTYQVPSIKFTVIVVVRYCSFWPLCSFPDWKKWIHTMYLYGPIISVLEIMWVVSLSQRSGTPALLWHLWFFI